MFRPELNNQYSSEYSRVSLDIECWLLDILMQAKILCPAISLFLLAMAAHADAWSTNLSCFNGGSYDGWDRHAMTNAAGLGGAQVTLSSGTNEAFDWTQAAELAALTIAVENPAGMMTNGGTLRIVLPATFGCRFNTNSTVTCSGSASGKVGAASFSDAGRTVRIPVTADLAAADTLIVSGLALADLRLARQVTDRLALDLDGDGAMDIVDLYTVELRVSWPGSSYDGWDFDAMSRYGAFINNGTIVSVW